MNVNNFVNNNCNKCHKLSVCVVYQFLNNIPQLTCLNIQSCDEWLERNI